MILSLIIFIAFCILFILIYRRFDQKKYFYIVLLLSITVYLSSFTSSAIRFVDFQKWKSENSGELEFTDSKNQNSVKGILLPHRTCSLACRKLLFFEHAKFIETKNLTEPKTDEHLSRTSQESFERWSLKYDPEFCWKEEVVKQFSEYIWRGGSFSEKSWLAQGLCLQKEQSQTSEANLIIDREIISENKRESITYKVFAINDSIKTEIAVSRFFQVKISIPFLFKLKGYYLPIGVFPVESFLSHGIARIDQLLDAFFDKEFPHYRRFPIHRKSSFIVIEKAVRSKIARVRWSAANALCHYKHLHKKRSNQLIQTLINDNNIEVSAAAKRALRQRKGLYLCGFGRPP